jgi:hypothetical protein
MAKITKITWIRKISKNNTVAVPQQILEALNHPTHVVFSVVNGNQVKIENASED